MYSNYTKQMEKNGFYEMTSSISNPNLILNSNNQAKQNHNDLQFQHLKSNSNTYSLTPPNSTAPYYYNNNNNNNNNNVNSNNNSPYQFHLQHQVNHFNKFLLPKNFEPITTINSNDHFNLHNNNTNNSTIVFNSQQFPATNNFPIFNPKYLDVNNNLIKKESNNNFNINSLSNLTSVSPTSNIDRKKVQIDNLSTNLNPLSNNNLKKKFLSLSSSSPALIRAHSTTTRTKSSSSTTSSSASSLKRRRKKSSEVKRYYKCTHNGCDKSYGTLNHLNTHILIQRHGVKKLPSEFIELRRIIKLEKQEQRKFLKNDKTVPHKNKQKDKQAFNVNHIQPQSIKISNLVTSGDSLNTQIKLPNNSINYFNPNNCNSNYTYGIYDYCSDSHMPQFNPVTNFSNQFIPKQNHLQYPNNAYYGMDGYPTNNATNFTNKVDPRTATGDYYYFYNK